MTDRTAEAGIEAIYRTYVDTFNREDAAGVARLLSYPAMMGGTGSSPIMIPDEAAYQRLIEGTFEQFKAKGWVRSQVDKLQPVATAGDTGVLFANFSRYRKDGSLLETGSGHYVMLRRDGRWSIIAAIADL
jgi:ketosteroid isomerase-like protein